MTSPGAHGEGDGVPVEDRDAFVLGAVTDPANRPAVYHKSPAACAFNAAYDAMEQKYPKRKDQKKAGIDLAVEGWKGVDSLLREADARANTAKVATDLMRAERDALRGEVATLRGARSAEDVCEMLCEASCVDVTPERCARIWSLLEHPATTMTTLAVIADERGESYATMRARAERAEEALRELLVDAEGSYGSEAWSSIAKARAALLTQRGEG